MRIFVTGATGLIGRALCVELVRIGHEVTGLSRWAEPALPTGVRAVQGDPAAPGPWLDALHESEACVHLAGEPVAEGRWNAEKKRRIRGSRIDSTRVVAGAIAEGGPTVLLSGSAVGFYGSRGDEELTEDSPPGEGFLSEVCQDWEAAAEPARRRARVVKVRTGIVLAREGGALPRMALPFKLMAGGPIGDGRFWQPWIHLADQVGLLCWALGQERVRGLVNATSPAPARNRDLARAMGRALHRPSLLPTPALALRLAMGEMAEVVTASQRVLPRRALDLGYRYRFPELGLALTDLLR